MERSGSAVDEEGELGRVVAAFDRDGTDRLHHGGAGDPDDAERGLFDIETERPREVFDRRTGQRPVDRHPAVQKRRVVQPAEDDVGVGDRRLRAPRRVAGGSGYRAGAPRPDLEQPVLVDPCDGAAPRAHRIHVERGQTQGEAGEGALVHLRRPRVAKKAHVRAGAADVEGDDVAKSGRPSAPRGSEHPRRRSRQRGADRIAARHLHRHETARALAHLRFRSDPEPGHSLDQAVQVGSHRGQQGAVQHRGREPFELPKLRIHRRRRDDPDRVGKRIREDPDRAPLVLGPRVRMEEADHHAVHVFALEHAPRAREAAPRRGPGAPSRPRASAPGPRGEARARRGASGGRGECRTPWAGSDGRSRGGRGTPRW